MQSIGPQILLAPAGVGSESASYNLEDSSSWSEEDVVLVFLRAIRTVSSPAAMREPTKMMGTTIDAIRSISASVSGSPVESSGIKKRAARANTIQHTKKVATKRTIRDSGKGSSSISYRFRICVVWKLKIV
jgi:hypothetical protein